MDIIFIVLSANIEITHLVMSNEWKIPRTCFKCFGAHAIANTGIFDWQLMPQICSQYWDMYKHITIANSVLVLDICLFLVFCILKKQPKLHPVLSKKILVCKHFYTVVCKCSLTHHSGSCILTGNLSNAICYVIKITMAGHNILAGQ